MALVDNLIIVIKNGRIIGNPKMAINTLLLSAFEAIAEIMVNKEERPTPPSTIEMVNRGISTATFPKKRL